MVECGAMKPSLDAAFDNCAGTGRRRRAAAMPLDERRAMIIDAALPLLIEHGESVTTLQIAEAAGVAEGTVFRAFATKEDIVDAVIARVTDPGPVEEAIAGLDTAAGLEATVIEVVRIIQKRMADGWQLWSSVGARVREHTVKSRLGEGSSLVTVLDCFRDELDVSPEEAAPVLRSLTFALTFPVGGAEPAPPERVARIYLHGVGSRSC